MLLNNVVSNINAHKLSIRHPHHRTHTPLHRFRISLLLFMCTMMWLIKYVIKYINRIPWTIIAPHSTILMDRMHVAISASMRGYDWLRKIEVHIHFENFDAYNSIIQLTFILCESVNIKRENYRCCATGAYSYSHLWTHTTRVCARVCAQNAD